MTSRQAKKARKYRARLVDESLTETQKKELLAYRDSDKTLRQQDLADYCQKKFNVKIDQPLISAWLIENGYRSVDRKRAKVIQRPQLPAPVSLSQIQGSDKYLSALRDIKKLVELESVDYEIRNRLMKLVLVSVFSQDPLMTLK